VHDRAGDGPLAFTVARFGRVEPGHDSFGTHNPVGYAAINALCSGSGPSTLAGVMHS
jgi:hypothetical protein